MVSVTKVSSSIPQGSVLGLVVFLMLINDLPDVEYFLADDTNARGAYNAT